MEPRIEMWLSPEAVEEVEYSEYWNAEDEEHGKAFDVKAGDFARMEHHLRQTGLQENLEGCLEFLRVRRGWAPHGSGVDLAAGALWAVPTLITDEVERLYCVEISKHRLLDLGPRVLDHYEISQDRVVLALGSFYDLRVQTDSLDFALLSQALHHADRPLDLLREVKRVLAPGGVAMVIGEHRIGTASVLRHVVKSAVGRPLPASLRRKVFKTPPSEWPTLRPRGSSIYPPDPTLGDHFYLPWEYQRMFEAAGFEATPLSRRTPHHAYILEA